VVLVRLAGWVVEQAVYLVMLAQVWVAEEPLQVVLVALSVVGMCKLFEVSK